MSKVSFIPSIEAGVRCYPVRQKQDKKRKRDKARAIPKDVFVFDTETLTDETQALTFGSWRILRRPDDAPAGSLDYPCLQEGIFYADNAPPDAIERLRAYVATRRAEVDLDRGGDPLIKLGPVNTNTVSLQ